MVNDVMVANLEEKKNEKRKCLITLWAKPGKLYLKQKCSFKC